MLTQSFCVSHKHDYETHVEINIVSVLRSSAAVSQPALAIARAPTASEYKAAYIDLQTTNQCTRLDITWYQTPGAPLDITVLNNVRY